MELFFRRLSDGPAGQTPVVIMHGLFGSSDNWQTLGKALATHYSVYLLDLPHHGRSPHRPRFHYADMAADVSAFLAAQQINPAVLVGHSMGGKVAMQIALTHPEAVERLVVVDIAPRAYAPHHQAVLAGFGAVPLAEVANRKEAEAALLPHVPEPGVRQFMLKNLYRTDTGAFGWRPNLAVLERDIEAVGEAIVSQQRFDGPALFVRGERSDYVRDADREDMARLFPNYELTTIPNAGHWVHAEQPAALLEMLRAFIGSTAG